ncbi:hypothetical protein HZP94_01690 [Elizabethkingia anophelis]|nr:hypothetical protein [Elizabethkingia anophelis]MCT3957994.1 hypothetical protein [Elizabethkingia anophelis]MCT4060852.1 hypothetical protein [Elizabethkingia anophelis]MCT4107144.1 hypothetical protein [Elizabethkingia anophelis]
MKKILLVLTLISAGTIVQAQSYGAIIKKLDRLSSENSGKDYDEFILEGKKFITVKDSTDHSEKHILEFRPNNQVTMIEIIEDKSTKQEYSNIFTGDVVRNHNAVSVRLDKLEEKAMSYPLTYNLLLGYRKGYYYLTNINTREKWIEIHYLDKTKDSQKVQKRK